MGETFDVEVTFPENYGSADLAGKKATFTMKLHTIYDLTLLDEEVKTFSKNEFSNYADLLKDYIDAYRSQEIWNILTKEATYENLPIEYYDYFYNYYRDYYHSYAFSMGMEYDAFLKAYYGITDADLMKESQTVALPYIIAQKIFKTENLAADKETYDAKYKELLDQYVKDAMEHFKYSEEDAKKFVEAEEGTNLNATVIRELVSEWLLTQNN
jgi:trigger factor